MSFVRRLKANMAAAVPALTVAATLGLAFAVYRFDDARGGLSGFAQGVPEVVAPLDAARVAAVHVSVGAEVEEGQIVATLDTSAIDGEIAVARADKARIEADIRAERNRIARRLDVDRESLERATTKEREDLRRATAEAQALESEIARMSKLVADRQAVATQLVQMNLRHAELTSLLAEKPRTLGVLAKQLDAAVRRRDEVDAKGSADADKLDAELRVVDRRIENLERRRAAHSLRATRKGRVTAIDKQPGETVSAGEPIVRLVGPANRVTVCVPERRSLGLREGEVARLWRRGQGGAPLVGHTVAVGPVVAELPARCWASPRLPVWGREVTVALDAPADIVAGAAFDVLLGGTPEAEPPSMDEGAPVAKRGSAGAAPSSGLLAAEPRPMVVPAALARRTRFEPSGVLARPGENRYLVVSDDTGIKDGPDDGRPWLFAMNAAGAVSPTPITITGVSAIDDLESIAAGDDGEVYVLASQSYSKKGRRSPARTALLRLRRDGDGFKVDGEVHLAELLDAAPARAAALGVAVGARDLDVEGMTFHRGALYFGLKAPVDARGAAAIWRAAAPKSLFDASIPAGKRLEAAQMTAWGRVRLDVTVDGASVAGGISDLLFHDGALLLTSTPSTGDAVAGALWRVERVDPARGGDLEAKLVRRFPGRKPEGISPSLVPGRLMIVFDAGSATPSLLDAPWP